MNGRRDFYHRFLVERAIDALDKYTALDVMRTYTAAAFLELESPLAEHGAKKMREEQLLQQQDAAQRIEDEEHE